MPNRPGRRTLLALLLLTTLVAGCATTHARRTDADQRAAIAARSFGGHFEYFYVPAPGVPADRAYAGVVTLSPAELARQLAQRLAPARKRPVRILVSGPSPARTDRVILDALTRFAPGSLAHLDLLFVGQSASAARIREAVLARGGRFQAVDYRN